MKKMKKIIITQKEYVVLYNDDYANTRVLCSNFELAKKYFIETLDDLFFIDYVSNEKIIKKVKKIKKKINKCQKFEDLRNVYDYINNNKLISSEFEAYSWTNDEVFGIQNKNYPDVKSELFSVTRKTH